MAFTNQKIGKLEYTTCDSMAVPHCFSTRFGGVSEGYLESMNLGIHRGDKPENVVENYRIMGAAVGFDWKKTVFTRQTHTDIVRVVDGTNAGEGLLRPVEPECDALVTNTPGIALCAFTADCTPILLWDRRTGAVGAVHAGWRGTVAEIAAKTLAAMTAHYGTRPEDVTAAIGPNIGVCCFETGDDVTQALRVCLGGQAEELIRPKGEKYLVDLKGANRMILERAGVRDITLSTECTRCRPDRYWSHRKVGLNRGSMAAIIVCQEAAV